MKYIYSMVSVLFLFGISNLCYTAEKALVYFPFTSTFKYADRKKNLRDIMEHGAKPQISGRESAANNFFRSAFRPWEFPYFITTFSTMTDLERMSDITLHGLILEIYLDQNFYRLEDTLETLNTRLNDVNDPPEGNLLEPRRSLIRAALEHTIPRRTILGFDDAILQPKNIIRYTVYQYGMVEERQKNQGPVEPGTVPSGGYPFPPDVGILPLEDVQVLDSGDRHLILELLGCGAGAPHNATSQPILWRFSVNAEPICSRKPKNLSPQQFLDAEKKYRAVMVPALNVLID